jgi:release factor glutamine methyltransferase
VADLRWLTVVTPAGPLRVATNDCVYEPSDDSKLAVEALVKLKNMGRRYESFLDLGTGTGLLALAAGALFSPRRLAAVDISPHSVESARATLGPNALIVQCDAASCLSGEWDLVVLNPPYLPAGDRPWGECSYWQLMAFNEGENHLKLCRAAGRLGREVLVVRSSLSSLDVDSCLKSMGLLERDVVAERRLFMERLTVELWFRIDVR